MDGTLVRLAEPPADWLAVLTPGRPATPPDAALERVSRLAGTLLDASAVAVALSGPDASSYAGPTAPPESATLPGSCRHAAATGEVVARDGTEEAEAVLVVPIIHASGRVAGSIGVAAVRGRRWTQDDVATLRDLGDLVAAEAERRALARERERMEEGVNEAAGLYAAIVEASPLAMAVLDRRGVVRLWSPAAERMFGWTRDEALNAPSPIVPPGETDSSRDLLAGALAGERLTGVESVRRRKDGSRVHVSISTAPLPARGGEGGGALVIFADVTAHKLAEDAARESRERLHEALDVLPVGIFLARADGRVEWQNHASRHIWGGVDPHAGEAGLAPYKGWWAGTSRVMREEEWALPRALEGEAVSGQLVEIEGFQGRRRTIINSAFPLRDAAGAVTGAIVVNEDVTARTRAEEELRRRSAFVEMLQEVAVAANEAESLEEALQTTLNSVCRHTGWPLGHALLLDAQGTLASADLWHLPRPDRFASLRRALRGAPGAGLAGRVVERGEPVWTVSTHGYPSAAGEPEARAGFAFPIRVGREVVGVLEFFSERTVEPDERLLEVMSHVGTQLGRVVERRRALEALRESEERFRLTFEKSPLARWLFDARTLRILDVNEAALRQYGYTRQELLQMDAGALWPAGTQSPAAGADAAAWSGAHRHRTKEGALIDVEVTTHEIAHGGGKVLLSVALDVTERRRAEARLGLLELAGKVMGGLFEFEHRVESLARLTVPALADFCVVDVVGADGAPVRMAGAHADPSRAELLREIGSPCAAEPGGPFAALRGDEPVLAAEVGPDIVRALAPTAGAAEALRRLAPRSIMVLPLAARGRTLGAVTLASADPARRYGADDLSLAAELASRAALLLDNSRLYREATQATEAREEILAVVSHELRNPLAAIVAMVETLLHWLPDDAWRARERTQLESLLQTTGQMTRLVQDLLDVTRIEGGHFSVRAGPEDAGELIHETAELLRPLAERAGVRLESLPAAELPAVFADRQRVVQVIGNLVGNAVRLTPAGGSVLVAAETRGGELWFRVTDTGPGISPEHLPHLFERFWRPRRAGGLGAGLGLAISRGIVEAHGGRIWAESGGAGGSTFYFTLPAVREGAGATPPDEVSPYRVALELPAPAAEGEGGGEAALRERAARERAEAAERHTRFAAEMGEAAGAPAGEGAELVDHLREQIAAAVHMGHIREGDRLPSIREVSRRFGTTTHAAVHAYDLLASEHLVEKRGRSGMYVAPQGSPGGGLPGETAAWVADVLAGAFEHQIKIPQVPELIRRWTAGVRLRCACVESEPETLGVLCGEVQAQFGLDSHPVRAGEVASYRPGMRPPAEAWHHQFERCDMLVTTVYHAAAVRPWAEALGKPLVVATYNPEHAAAIERQLREGELTVVCTDGSYGQRVRAIRGGRYADRVRVVLADDREALAGLDPSRPVLITRAAHQRLDGVDLRLLVPLSPFLSPASARALLETVVRLNIQARRV